MRSPILLRSLPLIALLSACSDPAPAANTADVPDAAADVSTADRPDSGSPDAALDVGPTTLPDVPTADVPRTDVPRTDVPTADVPAADVPTADVPVAQDAPSTDDAPAEECVGRPAACVSGTAGGSCGDALVPPDCVGGSWRCPEGMIPITSCACVGRPPGACTCSPSGWVCPDAGR
nr:hypothetical protein [Deltaproteobacteria bacterium]